MIQRGLSRKDGYLQHYYWCFCCSHCFQPDFSPAPSPRGIRELYSTDWNLAQATARELITFSEPVFQSIKWDDGPHSESCCEMKCRDAQHRFRGLGAVLDTFYPFAHWILMSLPHSWETFREVTACAQGHTASEQQSSYPNLEQV